MTTRPPLAGLILLVALLGAVPACQTQSHDPTYYASGRPDQKYDFDYVKRRVKKIEKGTPRLDVLIELGSPARYEGNKWVYLPSRGGLLVPAEALEVYFRDGRFEGYATKPIILGERVTSP